MHPCPLVDADVLVKDMPMQFDTAQRYFMAKHATEWGGDVTLPPGMTWDRLGDLLGVRLGAHIWHPCHWEKEAPHGAPR